MISYILPTRDRPVHLARTLDALANLPAGEHDRLGGAELIIADNASAEPAVAPDELANGVTVQVLRRPTNEAAAARNAAADAANGQWLIMLDDDSHPIDAEFVECLIDAPVDVAVIGAEITLTNGRREDGGLPEVFIGCGAAIRRSAFLDAGGYDPSFGYYVEEYDLSARLLLAGWRITHDRRFKVLHEKVVAGRDMNLILQRLVRNNGWVAQRYAPDSCRQRELNGLIARYGRVALKESAAEGYARGMAELLATLDEQPRREMTQSLFDRFTGLAAARAGLGSDPHLRPGAAVAVVDEAKNAWAVRTALRELGVIEVSDERQAELLVIGTLSPGPMLDAWERRTALGQQVVAPWRPIEASEPVASGSIGATT